VAVLSPIILRVPLKYYYYVVPLTIMFE